MPEQKLLNTKVWCPSSGFLRKNGSVIPPHKIPLLVCSNGKLYSWCQRCNAKVFIQGRQVIDEMLEVSVVVEVRQKPRGITKKEGRNVAS